MGKRVDEYKQQNADISVPPALCSVQVSRTLCSCKIYSLVNFLDLRLKNLVGTVPHTHTHTHTPHPSPPHTRTQLCCYSPLIIKNLLCARKELNIYNVLNSFIILNNLIYGIPALESHSFVANHTYSVSFLLWSWQQLLNLVNQFPLWHPVTGHSPINTLYTIIVLHNHTQ